MQALGTKSILQIPISGVLNQITAAPRRVFDGVGQKLRGVFGSPAKQPPSKVTAETTRLRALQSERIKLKLFSRKGMLTEMTQIAESTPDYEIACIAVVAILNADADRDQRIEALAQLSKTESKAALPALVCLLNDSETETALAIFLERLEAGDYERLVTRGDAKAFTIIDILGGIDDATERNYSEPYFEKLYSCLASMPQKQMALLSEILGDPDPEEFRGAHEKNMVRRNIKFAAINLLQTAPVAVVDRALAYGAQDGDPDIAYNAIVALNQLWQTPAGRLPAGLEPFPLLDTDTLVRLCQLSSSFSWPDVANAESLLQSCREGAAELEQHEPNSEKYGRVLEYCRKLEDQVVRLTERRINCLQPLLNRITAALRVPNAELQASDDPHSYAAYLIGTGTVKVNRSILLDDKPLSEELMSSLLHEIGHLEQDVLLIRMVADELDLKFGQHSDLLLPLYERYSQGIGYAPTSMFLLAVLRLRDDKPLTEGQRRRAHRLFDAMKQLKTGHDQIGILDQRNDRLLDSHQALNEGTYDSQILSCLKNQRSLDALFSKGEVPAVLLHEMSSCRAEIEAVMSSLASQGVRMPSRDIITSAQQLFSTEHQARIAPIVQRLTVLLVQVLREESLQLDRRLSELRRAGYHEAEAYTIPLDRVEVIVKALRQGW